MEHPVPAFLEQLLIIGSVAVVVALVLLRLRLPTLTVLLIAGAVVGPHGMGLIGDTERIQILAEVGVVLLLFTIGLEFSLARLARIGWVVALGGALQIGLTILAVVALTQVLGWPLSRGIFHGFLAALSSTAIVLRALSERAELDAPHGRFIVGVLLLQDLAVVPMMLLVPILAASETGVSASLLVGQTALMLGKAAALVIGVVVVARRVAPKLFDLVDRARSREVFLLSVLVVCIGTAWLSSLAGLSLALGAFLAGLVLADTEYAHRALSDVLPLRDVLASLFFISLGMLFDYTVLLERPVLVSLLFLGLFLGKGAIATFAAMAMRFPARVAVLAGMGLAQFGEFGFVLATQGLAAGLIAQEEIRPLLAAAILTMLITPVAVSLAPRLAKGAVRLRALERLLGARSITDVSAEEKLKDHVIVVGYGVAGQVLVKALRSSHLPVLVLELNADTVRAARNRGEPVYYADIAAPEALIHAQLAQARALVLLINDPTSAERAVQEARRLAPNTPILVRSHYLRDAQILTQLGATELVVEEVEAGLEMLVRVLRQMSTPPELILAREEEARAQVRDAFGLPHPGSRHAARPPG